jgi:hypothetical protein
MPSRETLWIVPLLGISLLVGMALTIFLSPAIGVPLLAIAAIIGFAAWTRRRAVETGGQRAYEEQLNEGVDFTSADRETLSRGESDHPAR